MPEDTKNMIAETFLSFVEQRNKLDKITVKELVAACHISRQTFYYHFNDMSDVVDYCAARATDELLAKSSRQAGKDRGKCRL